MTDDTRTTPTTGTERTDDSHAPRDGLSSSLGFFIAAGMLLGVAVGTALGAASGTLALGVAMGPALGLSTGLALYFVFNQPKGAGSGPAEGPLDSSPGTPAENDRA